ncbi:hypothetical protein K402DRAFT_86804 [Aulographum hederae CBS 113979]|uniref:Uncharacterized protein n=1 Tax=Aulographum hederae CBS 113979 TaxID=1176131 RepID=A0A6G1GZB9_9PEZI|nr:hypothetical protein K402DRAFT_86804 [Aulographum hederae CBS 113979]
MDQPCTPSLTFDSLVAKFNQTPGAFPPKEEDSLLPPQPTQPTRQLFSPRNMFSNSRALAPEKTFAGGSPTKEEKGQHALGKEKDPQVQRSKELGKIFKQLATEGFGTVFNQLSNEPLIVNTGVSATPQVLVGNFEDFRTSLLEKNFDNLGVTGDEFWYTMIHMQAENVLRKSTSLRNERTIILKLSKKITELEEEIAGLEMRLPWTTEARKREEVEDLTDNLQGALTLIDQRDQTIKALQLDVVAAQRTSRKALAEAQIVKDQIKQQAVEGKSSKEHTIGGMGFGKPFVFRKPSSEEAHQVNEDLFRRANDILPDPNRLKLSQQDEEPLYGYPHGCTPVRQLPKLQTIKPLSLDKKHQFSRWIFLVKQHLRQYYMSATEEDRISFIISNTEGPIFERLRNREPFNYERPPGCHPFHSTAELFREITASYGPQNVLETSRNEFRTMAGRSQSSL